MYSTWEAAQAACKGIPNEQHKGFLSHEEALAWVNKGHPASAKRPEAMGNLPPGSTALSCSFAEKDQVKALGARWNGTTWYVPPGQQLSKFAKWLPFACGEGESSAQGRIPNSAGESSAQGRNHSAADAPELVEGELSLFTDGACKGNQHVHHVASPAGWGVVVVRRSESEGEQCVVELFGPVTLDTGSPYFLGAEVGSNNTAELSAICEALLWLVEQAGPSGNAPAAIYYDSEYAAKQLQGLWKTNKNHALVQEGKSILKRAQELRSIRFEHVKGHSGHTWNDRADRLANDGAAGKQCKEGRWRLCPLAKSFDQAQSKRHDEDFDDVSYVDIVSHAKQAKRR